MLILMFLKKQVPKGCCLGHPVASRPKMVSFFITPLLHIWLIEFRRGELLNTVTLIGLNWRGRGRAALCNTPLLLQCRVVTATVNVGLRGWNLGRPVMLHGSCRYRSRRGRLGVDGQKGNVVVDLKRGGRPPKA